MKKVIQILASAFIFLTLTACGGNNDKTPSGNDSTSQTRETSSIVENDSSTPTSDNSQVNEDVTTTQNSEPEIRSNGEFKYIYDEQLNGIVIVGYEGDSADIVIPDTIEDKYVVKIGNSAFEQDFVDNTNIKSIKIPDSVTEIGSSAFYNCAGITSINIPESVTMIGNSVFFNCESLISIDIPAGVTTMGNSVFKCCTSLTSVTIHGSITEIGRETFQSCTSLTSVTIPDSVTSIGNLAFSGCHSLTDLEIPDSVTEIIGCNDLYTFERCKNIKITYKGKTYDYDHLDALHDAIYGE